ncbi:MAG TPA: MDR family MFS transporter [Ktedonobacterales bacterium]|jgi:EmrB/QacA subfamily drug resistance transporter
MADSLTPPAATDAATAEPQSIRDTVSTRRLIAIIVGLMLGMLLAALDQTVVGTALYRITVELGGQNISWVYTSYLLASTVGVPIYGKLSDVYGRRPFFLAGMVIFLIGSALSGTSQNYTQLIIYRGVQGLGAGAIMPIAQAIIGDIFPPAERGRWQGIFVAVFGLATILGPLLGGYITDNLGWRWVFYINMPIGILALIVAGTTMPNVVLRLRHRIDILGSMALVLWTVPLLLAISLGGSHGTNLYDWTSWQILALFGVAIAALVVFVVVEFRASEPIISPRLLSKRIFSISMIAMFLMSAGMFGAIGFLPTFVQAVMGQTATNSGVILTPMMLGFMFSSVIGGQLLSITGRYKFLALGGFAVAAVGMWFLSQMDIHTSNPELIRNMVITGLGIGVMMSLFTIVVQNAFPFRQLGEVTATLSFFRSMGSTFGIGILGSVLTNSFVTNLQATMPAPLRAIIPADQIYKYLGQANGGGASGLMSKLAPLGPQAAVLLRELLVDVRRSFATAFGEVFMIGLGAMVLAFVVTLFLPEIPLRRSHRTPSSGDAAAAGESGPTPVAADMPL